MFYQFLLMKERFEIPNLKLQIPNKFQALIFQMTRTILFEISNFGHWNLFGI